MLEEVLELQPDTILERQALPPDLSYESKDHGEVLCPHVAIRSPFEQGMLF